MNRILLLYSQVIKLPSLSTHALSEKQYRRTFLWLNGKAKHFLLKTTLQIDVGFWVCGAHCYQTMEQLAWRDSGKITVSPGIVYGPTHSGIKTETDSKHYET